MKHQKECINERISWDEYFLTMAFLASQRSFDPSTKCGCVIVSKAHRILSTGYNGPIGGIDDHDVPLTRPEKYYWMEHAERNALYSYNGSASDIKDGTAYITGKPCPDCLRGLLQKNIARIVIGDTKNAKMMNDDKIQEACQEMLKQKDIEIEVKDKHIVCDVLNKTLKHIE